MGRLKQFFKEKTKQKRSPNLGIHVCACAYCIQLVCKLAENQKKFLVNFCSFSLLTCIWQLPKGLRCLVEFDSQPLFGIIQGLVFAGIADLARPADKLSPSQSTALAATGKHTVQCPCSCFCLVMRCFSLRNGCSHLNYISFLNCFISPQNDQLFISKFFVQRMSLCFMEVS